MNDVTITVTGKWLLKHKPRTRPFSDFIIELKDSLDRDEEGIRIVLQYRGQVVDYDSYAMLLGLMAKTPDDLKVFLIRHHSTVEFTTELREQYYQQPAAKYKELFLRVEPKELVSIPFDLYLELKGEQKCSTT